MIMWGRCCYMCGLADASFVTLGNGGMEEEVKERFRDN